MRTLENGNQSLMENSDFLRGEAEVFSTVNIEITDNVPKINMDRRRRIHRVPPQLRLIMRKRSRSNHNAYDPVMFSLGPYHHGKPLLKQAEEFKKEAMGKLMTDTDRGLFCGRILDRIDEIRTYYDIGDEYNNETLAEMMLVDACFILYFILIVTGNDEPYDHMYRNLGMTGVTFMARDVHLLENQVPFWVVGLLLRLADNDIQQRTIINYLISKGFTNLEQNGDLNTRNGEELENQEPLHLLEVYRRTLLREKGNTTERSRTPRQVFNHRHWLRWRDQREDNVKISDKFKEHSRPFRSVTDLEAKGICFRPTSNCLIDLEFKSHIFYAHLHLPIIFVAEDTGDLFSNMIAFEMSPGTKTEFEVTSYVNFMKSLIESPRDVKRLRETGIIFSSLGGDEEVVQMFKEIDTYGQDNVDIFYDVKMRIGNHCESRAKTWVADLIHTYFRTPWTVIALFAAVFLLCLNFLQTYFTARSISTR